ncbi:pyridoxal-phosphate-dependent aminotransferase family protein [Lacisediminihabitans profunda]|uniref:Alanine--glyoxylate aminotransferase family protein n=1 Tax=Lacisediminihabitans profunda TaxID=2594790 RepID=A0A5C8UNQ0_9MICO|nr:alanine--glyoxylate aminotransferase family protein [Lacisediminihabitans profunda]TXN29938.1 alanine--glyoxylate aminotransferase family protein [Lacisediminihabitans profunda]
MVQLDFTLSAGPTVATPRTLAALGMPITYHYDPDFLEAFRRTERKVAELFRTTNDIVLMQGEAIVGLEGAARSLVSPGMHVLNLVQGVFGKGMGYWLTDFGAVLHEIEVAYNEAVDPAAVEEYLDAHPEIELVTLVASETPSGTVTDVSRIGPICRARGVLTLVDTVSGVGGMEFLTDEWGLDVCVAGAQKCLGGPPGVALVTVSAGAWQSMLANERAPRSSYLSLIDWKTKWLEGGVFPYTPSVSDMHGLEACLDQVLEEGVDASIARHFASADVARAGVRGMGLELWPASDDIAASCVTSVRLPDAVDHIEVRTHVREHYGVMLSSGQGAGNLIRIAHMGPTASGLHPVVGIAALGRSLVDLGQPVNVGDGVEAALAVLSNQQ